MGIALRDFFLVLTAVSWALTFWRWRLQRRFPLHQRLKPSGTPGVTCLKPLKGCDAETKACLRSWLCQAYGGPAQFLFGAASADDPVCGIARELLAEFPQADAQLVICPKQLGANAKVSTLQQLEGLVKHPILMISDADTRVPADFMAEMAPRATGAGLVNCFYRLANPATAAMRWEAVAVNADFWTSVLQAVQLKKMDFALGAVMTLPAAELKGIGGFAALADCLADDYQLGHRIAANGRPIELAAIVVDCWERPAGWSEVWRHQLRWARTIRFCQPAPFLFSVVNNGGVWPIFLLVSAAIMGGPVWMAAVGLAALGFRIWSAQGQQKRMTENPAQAGDAWMTPVKDMLDFLIWLAAFWGNRVEWRGQRYRVKPGGMLERE